MSKSSVDSISILKGVSLLTLSSLIAKAALIVVSIILARFLTTRDFSQYNYIYLTVMMLVTYSSMGLGVTASKVFAEECHENKASKSDKSFSLWFISLISTVVISILILFIPNQILVGQLDIANWVFAVGLLIYGVGVVPSGAILGLELYKYDALISMLSSLVLLVTAFLASVHRSYEIAVFGLFASGLVSSLIKSIILIRYMRLGARDIRIIGFTKMLSDALHEAGPLMFVGLFSASGLWAVGRLILNGDEGEFAYKLFSIGIQWFSIGVFLPGLISRALLPRLIKQNLFNENGRKKHRDLMIGMISALGISSIFLLFMLLFSKYIVMLYDIDANNFSWILIAFVLASLCASPSNILGNVFVASSNQRIWLYITIIWFISLLCSLLILGVDISNAIISISFSYCVMNIISFYLLRTKKLL